MEAEKTESQPAAPAGSPQGKPSNNGTSPLDAIRRKREAMGSDRTTMITVPGYDGMLAVQYKLVDWDRVNPILEKARTSPNPRADLLGAMDTISLATKEIMMRPEGLSEYVPMREAVAEFDDDEPVIWDNRLADALEISYNPRSPTRSTIYETFGKNDMAIVAHHSQLVEWLQGNSTAESEDF